jgi:ribosomal protein S18 acetylase RimI-like enzyme
MKECERRARDAGAKAIGLHTMEVMQDAIRMYERLGFVRTPETDFRPGEGVVVLGYRHTF